MLIRYLVPITVLFGSYLCRWLADHFCLVGATACANASDLFAHT